MRPVSTTSHGRPNVVAYVTPLLLQSGRESKTKSDAGYNLSAILEPILGTWNFTCRQSLPSTAFDAAKISTKVVRGCGVACLAKRVPFSGHLQKLGFPCFRWFNKFHFGARNVE